MKIEEAIFIPSFTCLFFVFFYVIIQIVNGFFSIHSSPWPEILMTVGLWVITIVLYKYISGCKTFMAKIPILSVVFCTVFSFIGWVIVLKTYGMSPEVYGRQERVRQWLLEEYIAQWPAQLSTLFVIIMVFLFPWIMSNVMITFYVKDDKDYCQKLDLKK